MNRSDLLMVPAVGVPSFEPHGEITGLEQWPCEQTKPQGTHFVIRGVKAKKAQVHNYSDDWVKDVPALIARLSSLVLEKRLHELNAVVNDFERRIHRLESIQTKVVPINTFAPEPYDLLKTILVSVFSVEGGFEAGWYDANIHTSGENEEAAVSNLKSLILDYYDSFSKEPAEKLGIEPKRQLAVIKAFIQKKP
jgi:hypothetical protein